MYLAVYTCFSVLSWSAAWLLGVERGATRKTLLRWSAWLAGIVVLGTQGLRHPSTHHHPLFQALGYSTIWVNYPFHWLAVHLFLRHPGMMSCHFRVLNGISKIFLCVFFFLHEHNPLVTHNFNFLCYKLTFIFKVPSKKQIQMQNWHCTSSSMVICLLQ